MIKEIPERLYHQATIALLENTLRQCKRSKPAYSLVKNRMLYVPSSSLPYHISGYVTRTHEVIRALVQAGVDIRVVTRPGYPWDRGDRVQHTDETLTHFENIKYEHVRKPSKHRPLLMFALQAAKAIEKIAVREKVGVIHAASNHENALPALIAARRLGIAFQYEMRGLWELTRASRIPGYENTAGFDAGLELEGLVAARADRVMVISEQLAKFAQKRWNIPAEHFALLPNCIDPSRFVPVDWKNVEHHTIGYAGSLISYEGLDTLIDAVDALVKKGFDIHVHIVGHGEAGNQLEEQVARLGLTDRVLFFGRVSPESAREIISKCALVCLPRKPYKVCEIVTPIKLVEALAMGKPVVVPDLPVFRDEMGSNPPGWFFRAGDSIDLANTLETALADRDALFCCGERAREYSVTQRSWQGFVGNVIC